MGRVYRIRREPMSMRAALGAREDDVAHLGTHGARGDDVARLGTGQARVSSSAAQSPDARRSRSAYPRCT
jgi:hypothetical protein